MRGPFVAVAFITSTTALIVVQWLMRLLRIPVWGFISVHYYRWICWLLRIRVHVVGNPVLGRPVLMIGNHVSWADIITIASAAPVAFVSKLEVGKWLFVGPVARLHHTIFIDRAKRHQTGDAIADIVQRLTKGIPVVLFAEGTSGDGNRVLPFRSSLVGAVKDASMRGGLGDVLIQPISICYTRLHGLPMGRQHRPMIAWYGDMDFMPHLKEFIRNGAIDAVITFGEPIAAGAGADRKEVAKSLETTVRKLTAATLRGPAAAANARL